MARRQSATREPGTKKPYPNVKLRDILLILLLILIIVAVISSCLKFF